MYRAATFSVINNKIDLQQTKDILQHVRDINLNVIWNIFSKPEIELNGANITDKLREKTIEDNVSTISKIPEIRTLMVEYQRNHAKQSPIVMAGRDIGTRVLVEANIKFFLHAPAEIRAARRMEELNHIGDARPFEDVLAQTIQRDNQDQTGKRAITIEQAADDATIVETADLSIEGLINFCADIYEKSLASNE
tara:strand:- start:666 stop:1247 length:582 start_codon:yes stop_codon:yes gene_type:complete